MEKTIILAGVEHAHWKLEKKARKFFEEKIEPNKKIGLEIMQKQLGDYEKKYSEGKLFYWDPVADYFYQIFKIAKKRNCAIVPLTSSSVLEKYSKADKRVFVKRNPLFFLLRLPQKRFEKITDYLRIPLQEKAISSRIIKEKPDLCVIGLGHADLIKELLVFQGIKIKAFFPSTREKPNKKEIAKDNLIRKKFYDRKLVRTKIRQEHNIFDAESKKEMLHKLKKTDLFLKVPKTRRKYFR